MQTKTFRIVKENVNTLIKVNDPEDIENPNSAYETACDMTLKNYNLFLTVTEMRRFEVKA